MSLLTTAIQELKPLETQPDVKELLIVLSYLELGDIDTDIIGELRSKLTSMLNVPNNNEIKHNEISLADIIYNTLLTLATLVPVNNMVSDKIVDPISLDEIDPEDLLVCASGYHFDINALAHWLRTGGYTNPLTRETFNLREQIRINHLCATKGINLLPAPKNIRAPAATYADLERVAREGTIDGFRILYEQLDRVEYLFALPRAFKTALNNGNLVLAQWIYARTQNDINLHHTLLMIHDRVDDGLIGRAAEDGHLATIQWYCEKLDEEGLSADFNFNSLAAGALRGAQRYRGTLEMIEFLFPKLATEADRQQVLRSEGTGALNPYYHIWLYDQYPELDRANVLASPIATHLNLSGRYGENLQRFQAALLARNANAPTQTTIRYSVPTQESQSTSENQRNGQNSNNNPTDSNNNPLI